MRRFGVPILAAIAACTCVAHADAIVQLVGQTPDQVRVAVTAAAEKVCTDAMIKHQLDDASSEDECVADTVDATMDKIKDGGGAVLIAAAGTH